MSYTYKLLIYDKIDRPILLPEKAIPRDYESIRKEEKQINVIWDSNNIRQ
jgi:hypothetical protein